MDNKNRNRGLLFFAGIVAGAATTYYLQSPSGKKMRKDVANKGKDLMDSTASFVESTANTTTEKLAEAKSKIREKTIDAINHAESSLDSFQKGMQQAKESLRNGVEAL